jgi:hypothetical protein
MRAVDMVRAHPSGGETFDGVENGLDRLVGADSKPQRKERFCNVPPYHRKRNQEVIGVVAEEIGRG